MPRKSNIVVELEQQISAAQTSWRETTEEIERLEATMSERIARLKQQEISYGKAIENYTHLLAVAKSTRIRQPRSKKPVESPATATQPSATEVPNVC